MVKITNPLDTELTLQFKGDTYTLGAGISEKFPADVAAQWITIYGFLSISGTADSQVDKMVEELTEEPTEETKEEPKKSVAKKTTKKK